MRRGSRRIRQEAVTGILLKREAGMPALAIGLGVRGTAIGCLVERVPAFLEATARHIEQLEAMLSNVNAIEVASCTAAFASYFPDDRVIRFSTRLLERFWAQTFAHNSIYDDLRGRECHGEEVVPGSECANALLRWTIDELRGGCDAQWSPSALIGGDSKEHRVADQQAMVALAFMIFHELAHAALRHRGGAAAADFVQLEMEADAMALDCMLYEYVNEGRQDFVVGRGVADALLSIACRGVHTGQHGDDAHPPGYQRLSHGIDRIVGADDDDIWAYVSLMLSLHMQKSDYPSVNKEGSWRDWCQALVDTLAE